MGRVYFAKAGELYKIGCSEDPAGRIKGLQTGCPVPITLVYSFETSHPHRSETAIKRRFADRRELGEWYRLTDADIARVKAETAGPATSVPATPHKPAGARTGALRAVRDIWVYRWHLLLMCVLSIPILVWLEMSRAYPEGYVDTGLRPPTAAATASAPTALPAGEPMPSPLPVAAPLPEGPALPVVQAIVEPTPLPELIPVNDATAEALVAIPPPGWAAPEPSEFVWPVTWPVPLSPTDSPIQEFAHQYQTTLSERGVTFLPITPVTPVGLLGR